MLLRETSDRVARPIGMVSTSSDMRPDLAINRQGMKMLNGKTALVTGSTSGIGLGIATAFAAQGANVVLNGFGDAAEIETLRSKLAAAHGVSVRYDGADLSKQNAIEAMMAKVLADFGSV